MRSFIVLEISFQETDGITEGNFECYNVRSLLSRNVEDIIDLSFALFVNVLLAL